MSLVLAGVPFLGLQVPVVAWTWIIRGGWRAPSRRHRAVDGAAYGGRRCLCASETVEKGQRELCQRTLRSTSRAARRAQASRGATEVDPPIVGRQRPLEPEGYRALRRCADVNRIACIRCLTVVERVKEMLSKTSVSKEIAVEDTRTERLW
jgi:hypothetical protein